MTKPLNQLIAIEKGTKARAEGMLTKAHHDLAKGDLINGLVKTYTPEDEERGERRPPEVKRVHLFVPEQIAKVREELASLFDVTASKDYGNCVAKANIVVDGKLLLENVPVTYLLFLEKQLVNLHTFVMKLPIHDPNEIWHFNASTNTYVTDSVQSSSTKKVKKNHVKAEATDKFPAQVETYDEDVKVGTWTTVKHTSALPRTDVEAMRKRVEKLQDAVKQAREQANATPVSEQQVGETVLAYIFG